MSDAILQVDNLMMRFGGIKALNDVSLRVERGSVTALIGPNGAGKTTVFNCLTGFYRASGGRIVLNAHQRSTDVIQVLGQKIQPGDWLRPARLGSRIWYKMFGGAHLVNRAGLARTFQNIRLFREMSVVENLLVAQHMQVNRQLLAAFSIPAAIGQRRVARSIALFTGWSALIWSAAPTGWPVRSLTASSAGWRLRAPCARPELICLDEPAAGLNPVETEALSQILHQLRADHRISVLLIEHDMPMVMRISDHIVVLDHGDVIAQGTPQQIRHDAKVIAAYLGAEEESEHG